VVGTSVSTSLYENLIRSVSREVAGSARRKIEQWRIACNRERPHSSLGNVTPEEFPALAKNRPRGTSRNSYGQGLRLMRCCNWRTSLPKGIAGSRLVSSGLRQNSLRECGTIDQDMESINCVIQSVCAPASSVWDPRVWLYSRFRTAQSQ
jgi:hypothetical protein